MYIGQVVEDPQGNSGIIVSQFESKLTKTKTCDIRYDDESVKPWVESTVKELF